MTIFRNGIDGRLYKMYKVSPPMFTGHWFEIEDLITGSVKKVNQKLSKKLFPVAISNRI